MLSALVGVAATASFCWYVRRADDQFRMGSFGKSAFGGAPQQPAPKWREIVDPGIYHFYSSLVGAEKLGLKERIAIADWPMSFAYSLHCNGPLPAEDQKLIDMVRDAEAAWNKDDELWYWSRRFHFGRDYLVVREVAQARRCVASAVVHHPLPGCGAYSNVRDIRALSMPVFNLNHSRALVVQASVLYGTAKLGIYQKIGDTWIPDSIALAGCKCSLAIP